MPIDAARAKSLFLAASELPAADRAAFLDRECGPDAALRGRVEALLRADAGPPPDGTGTFAPGDATADPDPDRTADLPGRDERVGAVLGGKYKLVEEIGEGGMGSVYLAQQTEPVKRAVAVKVIKAGMDSKAVLARFEAERQALAMMDHPNIARVLDAGQTESGRPFFVMELVKGVPITQFCDDRKLTPRQRLELFVPVCHAIQHAHQKGVIHRDVKPSNVLVALYDDRPVPKVIDFGVAKAAGSTLTDKTLMTGFGAVVGTPEYMSPEQASLNNLDVDTRSDVYALGVLLYELLTGTTPMDRRSLGKAALLEVLRVVREVEAPRPSAKLSTLDTLPSVAANRGTEPTKLSRLMRGELDWVLLKALEKDRTRRYDTANGLARDIQRYLADEVVEARPPSAGYRVRKFVRRHKGQVVAAGLVLFALLAGIAGTTWGLIRADAARRAAETAERAADDRRAEAEAAREAEAAQRREADAQRREAVEKAKESDALVRFFEEKVFAAARPKWQDGGLGKDVTLRDAIAAALPAVADGFRDQPLVEARLRRVLGVTFRQLGEGQTSAEQLERARAIFAEVLGADHPDTLGTTNSLANTYGELGLGRLTDELKLHEAVLAARRRLLPEDHPDTLKSMSNLAECYRGLGRYRDALELNEATLAACRRVLPADHPDILTSMGNLALSYSDVGRHAESLELREEEWAGVRKIFPSDHPVALGSMVNLANIYAVLGRPGDALAMRRQALDGYDRAVPPGHPSRLLCMTDLAISYEALGRHADALTLRRETLSACREALPPDHRITLVAMHNLGRSYTVRGRHADALKLYQEALDGGRRVLPPGHPDTLRCLWSVAGSLAALSRGAEAVPLIDECLANAAGKAVDPHMVPQLTELRLRHFQMAGNAAECRATAEKWEGFGYATAADLYDAACIRAVAAGLYATAGQPAEGQADADRAMAWLTKAVAAGYRDRGHLEQDADLRFLRGRPDFRALVGSLPYTAPPPRPVVRP